MTDKNPLKKLATEIVQEAKDLFDSLDWSDISESAFLWMYMDIDDLIKKATKLKKLIKKEVGKPYK